MYIEVNKRWHVVHLEGVLVKHRARMQSAVLHLMYARDALKPASVTPSASRNVRTRISHHFCMELF